MKKRNNLAYFILPLMSLILLNPRFANGWFWTEIE